MAQSALHAFAGIILSKFLKYEKWLIPSVIFGLLLPDLDIFFVIIGITDFKSSFLMHSFFFATLIYLVFLSLAEITSDKCHDSFLLDIPDFLNTIKNFLNTSYNKKNEKRI